MSENESHRSPNLDAEHHRDPAAKKRQQDHDNQQDRSMIANLLEAPVRKHRAQPALSPQLEKDLVQVFKLLADETRLRILFYLLREGELHVSALCDRLAQSQPAVSHHLALLRVAGLIDVRRDGKHNYYSYSVKMPQFQRIVEQLFRKILNEDEPARLAAEAAIS